MCVISGSQEGIVVRIKTSGPLTRPIRLTGRPKLKPRKSQNVDVCFYKESVNKNVNVETSIRYDHNQDPAVFKVTEINYNNEKTGKEKTTSELVFPIFGHSSRPSTKFQTIVSYVLL